VTNQPDDRIGPVIHHEMSHPIPEVDPPQFPLVTHEVGHHADGSGWRGLPVVLNTNGGTIADGEWHRSEGLAAPDPSGFFPQEPFDEHRVGTSDDPVHLQSREGHVGIDDNHDASERFHDDE